MKRSNYRVVVWVVISALVVLVLFQAIQLWSIYGDLEQKFRQRVLSAMDRAISENTLSQANYDITTKPLDSVKIQSIKTITISKPIKSISQINLTINRKSDFSIIDSLLLHNLEEAIQRVEIRENGEVRFSQGQTLSDAVLLSRRYGELQMSVWVENPNGLFMGQMAALIAASLLITLLIGFVFYYLLRTLFRQKSVEQMRLDFTHNITHELKTPIAVAFAANDALLNFPQSLTPEQRVKYLKTIEQSLGNLSEMVDKILTMTTQQQSDFRLNYSAFDLVELARATANHFSGAVFLIEPAAEVMLIRADKFHLANALNNLIDNAVKYSSGISQVRIALKFEERSVVVEVADNGIGMEQGVLPHIFEKFYRVPTGDVQNVRGFGLGLYYVRSIVEQHSGTIEVSSKIGRGTKFKINLPQ